MQRRFKDTVDLVYIVSIDVSYSMAGVRVVETIGLLCLIFQILVNQVVPAWTAKLLNYPVKEQNFRTKRRVISESKLFGEFSDSSYRNRPRRSQEDCPNNGPVDKVNGFSWIRTGDFNVDFIQDGKYSVKVSWETPKGNNGSSPDGYWFTWLVHRDNGQTSSQVCDILSAEKNWFVIHESRLWKRDEYIYFSIKPLPSSFSGRYSTFQELQAFAPVLISTTDSTSTSTEPTTKSTNDDRTSRSTKHTDIPSSTRQHSDTTRSILEVNNVASGKKQSKEKKIFTVTIVAIATAAVSLLGFVVVLRCRRREKDAVQKISRDPGYIYISYIYESESHTAELIDFGSWFRKQGYNVQMDIMLTPDKQEQLKELGRGRWGESQLKKAKNVFMILSPSYLNLCRLDEGKTDPKSMSEKENIVFSEISQIRDELSSRAYISSRFIPVLFGVKETELPFWIKQRVVYSWPEDKMNQKLLYRINEEVAHDNQEISDASEYTTAPCRAKVSGDHV